MSNKGKKKNNASTQSVISKVEKAKKNETPATTPAENIENADVQVIDPKKEQTSMIDEILNTPVDSKFQSLSQEGRLRYAELIERVYINPKKENTDPYVKAIADSMTRVFHATMVSIALRESILGKNEYSVALQLYAYPQIQKMAKEIGYSLPEPEKIKALSKEELKKFGITITKDELTLKFKDENASKELKKKLKEEGFSKIPELDVSKVDSTVKLKAALEYLMNKPDDKGNIVKSLLHTVAWMKQFRFAEAEKLKDKDAAKDALNKREFIDWLNDITNVASPTILFLNIGSQYKQFILEDKSPIRAFLSLRSSINGGEKNKLSDEDVAALLSTIVSWVVGYTVEQNEKYLSGSSPKLTDDQRKKYEQSNLDCHNVIEYMTNCDESQVTNVTGAATNPKDFPPIARTCYCWILSSYFGDQIVRENKKQRPEDLYENCEFNVTQQAGVICNYFRTPANKFTKYSKTNISKLVKKENKPVDDKPSDNDESKKE